MKTRGLIALATLALAVTLVSMAQSPFPADAQPPAVPPPQAGIPEGPPIAPPPGGHMQSRPTLPQLIAHLKHLRQQEKEITDQIKKVIADQKQSLQEAEEELRQLGIGASRYPVAEYVKKEETKGAAPPPFPIPDKK
jgi:hypothetical protein